MLAPPVLGFPKGWLLRTILDHSEDTIYFKDLKSKFILNSKAHAAQLGEADARAMAGKDDFCYFPEEFARAAYEDEQAIIRSGKPIVGRVEKWLFKSINDSHGHLAGDCVIRKIGEVLSAAVRTTDYCFRNGGDEFALILMGTELESARLVAEKLRASLATTAIDTGEASLSITISMGVACSSEADGVNSLLKLADERLYQSKARGRNQVS